MIEKVPALARLCKHLQGIPYLASKNLYRVATYFLTEKPERVQQLCNVLIEASKTITPCSVCCVWKEKERECVFCADLRRDHSIVCVVETWQELIAIEKTEGYKGVYHVLGGVICPLEGIGPEELSIDVLVNRVAIDTRIKEIILATNQTPEGEATAAFIARKLRGTENKVSCLARGIPVGSSLEMMDKLTVYKALSERRPF
ncbi:recombination mediator RecR [Candidatus Babeliales bacterium]|nr:recombination mediator RecR [Candidatus Babeliales bacterium]